MMQSTNNFEVALSATAALVNHYPFLRASAEPTKAEYEQALAMVEYLIDNDDENPLIAILTDKIAAYEDNAPEYAEFNASIAKISRSVAMLRYLMDQNGLNQSSFKDEIGSHSLVSMILKGDRNMTLEHMTKLAKRFKVPRSCFMDDDE